MAGKNILVVDDDSKAVNKIVEVLEQVGYAVFSSSSKSSAVELASRIRPSLIYVNAILTDASGLEITRSIRTLDFIKDVPIIMLTEMEEEFNDRYKTTYGIIGFLKKPIDSADLLRKTSSFVPLDGPALQKDSGHGGAGPAGPDEEEIEESSAEEKQGAHAFRPFEETERPDEQFDKEILPVKEEEGKEKVELTMKKPAEPGPSLEKERESFSDALDAERLTADEESDIADYEKAESWADMYRPGIVEGGEKKDPMKKFLIIGVAVTAVVAILVAWFVTGTGKKKALVADRSTIGSETKKEEKLPAIPHEESANKEGAAPAPAVETPQTAEKPAVTAQGAAQETSGERAGQKPASAKEKPSLSRPENKKTSHAAEKKSVQGQSGKYSVQVGYFSVAANAESLSATLRSKNYDVFIDTAKKGGGTRYRVLVGRYKTRDEAMQMLRKMKKAEKLDAAIYQRRS
jgi:CheY-like chemotaxis protein/cell division septation protein DedD